MQLHPMIQHLNSVFGIIVLLHDPITNLSRAAMFFLERGDFPLASLSNMPDLFNLFLIPLSCTLTFNTLTEACSEVLSTLENLVTLCKHKPESRGRKYK